MFDTEVSYSSNDDYDDDFDCSGCSDILNTLVIVGIIFAVLVFLCIACCIFAFSGMFIASGIYIACLCRPRSQLPPPVSSSIQMNPVYHNPTSGAVLSKF